LLLRQQEEHPECKSPAAAIHKSVPLRDLLEEPVYPRVTPEKVIFSNINSSSISNCSTILLYK